MDPVTQSNQVTRYNEEHPLVLHTSAAQDEWESDYEEAVQGEGHDDWGDAEWEETVVHQTPDVWMEPASKLNLKDKLISVFNSLMVHMKTFFTTQELIKTMNTLGRMNKEWKRLFISDKKEYPFILKQYPLPANKASLLEVTYVHSLIHNSETFPMTTWRRLEVTRKLNELDLFFPTSKVQHFVLNQEEDSSLKKLRDLMNKQDLHCNSTGKCTIHCGEASLRTFSFPIKELSYCKKLIDTLIEERGLAQLTNFPQLHSLRLEGNVFIDADFHQIAICAKELQSLSVRSNQITDDGIAALAHFSASKKFPALTDLVLETPKITDHALENLVGITTLQILSLQGCIRITTAGVEAFMAKLPKLALFQTMSP